MTVEEPDCDEYIDEDPEHVITIRMKWCADGSRTMDDIIDKLQQQIAYIRSLKNQGFKLVNVMNDDYGYAVKDMSTLGDIHEVVSTEEVTS